jgi:hypothetical protein
VDIAFKLEDNALGKTAEVNDKPEQDVLATELFRACDTDTNRPNSPFVPPLPKGEGDRG